MLQRQANRFKRQRLLFLLLSVNVCEPAFAQTLYKTVDSKGRTSFSDKPVSSASQPVAVQVQPPNPEDATRLQAEVSKSTEYAQRLQNQKLAEQQKAAESAEQKRQMKSFCAEAQYRYQVLSEGGRIVEVGEKGERNFLSSDDIVAGREEAKAAVDEYCSE